MGGGCRAKGRFSHLCPVPLILLRMAATTVPPQEHSVHEVAAVSTSSARATALLLPLDWATVERVCTPDEVTILRAFAVDHVLDPIAYFATRKQWPTIGSVFTWKGAGGSSFGEDRGIGAWTILNGTLLCCDVWDALSTRTIEAAGNAYYETAFGRSLGAAPSAHPVHRVTLDLAAAKRVM
jgi:hypothetical protein